MPIACFRTIFAVAAVAVLGLTSCGSERDPSPPDGEFTADLDDETHALLRARGRALSDKKATTAAELHEQLRERGVVVRDRDGGQQFRRA